MKKEILPQQVVRAVMLVLLTMFVAFSFPTAPSSAAQASLAWDAPLNSDGTSLTTLAGYKIYAGTAPGIYSQNVDVGNQLSYTFSNLADNMTYYFAVSAYDTAGNESSLSSETSKSFQTTAATYQLTASASPGGTVSPSGSYTVNQATNGTTTISSLTVASGSSVTFAITPASGYSITGVSVDGASIGKVTSYTFSGIAADHTIDATFGASSVAAYTITATAGTGGSISPAGSTTVSSGAATSYTITPSIGYYVASVVVDGATVASNIPDGGYNYTFSNTTANHTISASFAVRYYHIVATAGTGGTISPADAWCQYNSSQTISITPSTGYRIADVKVDGVSVGAVSSYTFSKVSANHTIQASFASSTAVGTIVHAINCGGAQYINSTKQTYKADTSFTGGSTYSSSATISGTTDGTLYKSERWGNFSYNLPVTNGKYAVTLKFAELVASSAGSRIFSVKINGTTVISNLDIYAKVGKNKAYDVTLPVTVTNGTITVQFISQVNNAKVSAILVKTN